MDKVLIELVEFYKCIGIYEIYQIEAAIDLIEYERECILIETVKNVRIQKSKLYTYHNTTSQQIDRHDIAYTARRSSSQSGNVTERSAQTTRRRTATIAFQSFNRIISNYHQQI